MVVKEDSSPWRKNYFFAVEGAIAQEPGPALTT